MKTEYRALSHLRGLKRGSKGSKSGVKSFDLIVPKNQQK